MQDTTKLWSTTIGDSIVHWGRAKRKPIHRMMMFFSQLHEVLIPIEILF
jgi:hypothetical protein